MTRHGNAQPELDPEALEAARDAYYSFKTVGDQLAVAIRAYLLAAGGTGEREERADDSVSHERRLADVTPDPGVPQRPVPATLRWRAGALADAVRLVAGESGDWRPQGRQKQVEWEAALDELEALDAALASPSPVSPAGREDTP